MQSSLATDFFGFVVAILPYLSFPFPDHDVEVELIKSGIICRHIMNNKERFYKSNYTFGAINLQSDDIHV